MITYPKITVVTPSYNQGQFIGECIDSVLAQNYPNLEYIIVDGASTDNTVEVIKKYDSQIAYWVSESDNGQSHAINKGFAQASGDIYYWLCSDDLLAPGALHFVAEQFKQQNTPQWLVGAARLINKHGREMRIRTPSEVNDDTFLRWASNWIPTQAVFWNKEMWKAAGPFDEDLDYVMDLGLWEKMYCVAQPLISDQILGIYRFHDDAKSISQMDQSKKERLRYTTLIIEKKLRPLLREDIDKDTKNQFIADYAKLLEEASDYRAALEEINSHKIFGRILSIWRKFVYARFGKV